MHPEIENLLPLLEGEDKSSPFANCLRKSYKHLRKWAKRTHTNCFRIYDRDIHHIPLVIDYYAGRFCVQYFAKSKEENEPPASLVEETESILARLFGVSKSQLYWRMRMRRKETRQYEKRNEVKEFFVVLEYGVKFLVNLVDYLDTGLFLDHRETRQYVAQASVGKRLLNLFAYTCSFSVQAATMGATFTKSVDMSNTYTDWGRKNFLINHAKAITNPIVRADCLKILDDEIFLEQKYDVIVIDPPTISRSKKMDELFDVQIGYIQLIEKSLKLLYPGGIIFFSTNLKKFDFNHSLFSSCQIEEITSKTIAIDFKDHFSHRCWKIQR